MELKINLLLKQIIEITKKSEKYPFLKSKLRSKKSFIKYCKIKWFLFCRN